MSTCSCIAETACDIVASGDTWDDFYEEERELSKDRRCCECGETLRKGSMAFYTRGWMWDRDEEGEELEGEEDPDTVSEDWTCKGCHAIRKDLYGGCIILGELREMLSECLGFDYVTGEYDEEDEPSDAERARYIKESEERQRRLEELRYAKTC